MSDDTTSAWFFIVKLLVRKALLLDRPALFGTEPDMLRVPPGYTTWTAYAAERSLTVTDFLPLGDPAEGCKLNAVFTRTGEDVATIGMHFVHANPDLAGDTLAITDAELEAIEGSFSTLWDTMKEAFPSSLALDRYEWHNFGVGIRRPNPKRRETILTPVLGAGAPADQLPPQVASSVTMRTSHRKTWGRVYMPAPLANANDTGRMSTVYAEELRTAFGTFADAVVAGHTPLVVWSPRRAGAALQYGEAHHAADDDLPDTTSFAKSVDIIQVDDLWDVIRSRRFDRASIKPTHTIGA